MSYYNDEMRLLQEANLSEADLLQLAKLKLIERYNVAMQRRELSSIGARSARHLSQEAMYNHKLLGVQLLPKVAEIVDRSVPLFKAWQKSRYSTQLFPETSAAQLAIARPYALQAFQRIASAHNNYALDMQVLELVLSDMA